MRTLILLTLLASCLAPDVKKLPNKDRIVNSMVQSLMLKYPSVPNMSVTEYMRLPVGEYVLVDVRELDERSVSIIDGAISKEEFLSKKLQYQNSKVICYDTIGSRCMEFAGELQREGYQTFNLKGGVLGWAHAGLEFASSGKATKKVHIHSEAFDLLPKGYEGVAP